MFTAQILGAIAAAAVVSGLFPGAMGVTTGLSPGVSTAQGLFIEMFLTAELIFTIFMLAVEKSKATFLAPIGIGLALFIAELAGVYYTGTWLIPRFVKLYTNDGQVVRSIQRVHSALPSSMVRSRKTTGSIGWALF